MANPRLPAAERRRRIQLLTRYGRLPSGTRVTSVLAGGVSAEWVEPRNADSGSVLLYLHGGGYAAGSPATHRLFVARLAHALRVKALVPSYRLAPEHPFPCAVDDVVAVYRWLLDDEHVDPARLVVAGDSAGGGLTLALSVSVRDDGRPLPAALACLSPWTDLACTGESIRTRAHCDPCFRPSDLRLQAREYLGEVDPRHPLASPLYADLRGLPPLLVQVGEDELLLDDARRTADRARAMGVDVTLEVWPGLWHIFQTLGTFPESRAAMQRLGHFLHCRLAVNGHRRSA